MPTPAAPPSMQAATPSMPAWPAVAAADRTDASRGAARADATAPEAIERPSAAPTVAAPAQSLPGDARPAAPPPMLVPLEAAGGPGWRLEAEALGPVTPRSEAPSPAAGPPPVAQQIAAAVARAADGQVEIRLDPPELGRVQIRIETLENGVRALVLAERPETQELLRRNADQLARDLGAAGFERVSLDFSAGGQAAARRERAAVQFAVASQGVPAEAPLPSAPRARASAAGGLDIRL